MPRNETRRRAVLKRVVAGGAVLTLEPFGFLRQLPAVSASESRLPADSIQFTPDIEPLVRLLEETPREKIVATFAGKILGGTSYRDVLAALLLAGVRNVQPRPSVGFKFHAVLVVNSAHLASLAAPASDRWLPIFWALDYFKSSQELDEEEGDWTMLAVDESKVPPPHRAKMMFRRAMEQWDVDAADVAVASLSRSVGAAELFDLFAHYGCRDYRSIGHKSIYVANSFRTLQCIGWRYAEPVLRSLAYALLNHNGEPNPAQSDLAPDAAWQNTSARIADARKKLRGTKLDTEASLSLLDALRTANPSEAVDLTSEMLSSGISTQSISDALFLSAGEMLRQQPGIISLHSATTTNAMQYAFKTTYRDSTRLELLLQNAAFIPHFRESMKSQGEINERRIDNQIVTQEVDSSEADQLPSVEMIFAQISDSRDGAALTMQNFLDAGGEPESLMNEARRLVFLKGTDSHDYKFSSAALEDFYAVSPALRNAYLASAAYLLPGSKDRDNGLMEKVQDALVG